MAKTSKLDTSSMQRDPMLLRIGNLKRERAELEEEVLQLRAAVKIWTAVCDHAISRAEGSQAFSAEMR